MDRALWLDTAKSLYNIKGEIKKLKEMEEKLAEKLQELSDYEPQIIGGMQYTFSTVKGTIDYSLIPQLKNVDLDKFRKPGYQRWALTVESIQDLLQ